MSASHLATDIDSCQYRRMSKSLVLRNPAGTVACCPPLSQEPISAEQARQIAPMLKALADPVRLRLMSLVASHSGGEACVGDLTGAFDLSQPTISHHLKVLHETGLLARFEREARHIAAMSHPRIGTVFDCGIDRNTPFIVMELVAGQTLRQVLDEIGPLSPRGAVTVAA